MLYALCPMLYGYGSTAEFLVEDVKREGRNLLRDLTPCDLLLTTNVQFWSR
jgi:hypothetical protein